MEASGSGMQLEKFVKGQLKQSIQNADVLSMLQRMVASVPDNEEAEEVRQTLQQILDHYETLDEGDKEYFLSYLKQEIMGKLAAKLEETPIDMTELEEAIKGAIMGQVYLVAAVAVVIFLILVFFGYKLYRSIKDKKTKQEEKKKLKQLKKKK
ncbi:uncharacterized protein LOC120624881 [Pararge aegeria]|uniref:uncharacterized protein LOC120624881 n=1 Tax=Pararge aegeria TaxID=116150 RepID=UPI0019D237A7|nr:uncharacterized protein LOC120624881 [Pararge aegeria]XP_039747577.1 uncharacterized protein LOC120624881 [Pararge aegeria]